MQAQVRTTTDELRFSACVEAPETLRAERPPQHEPSFTFASAKALMDCLSLHIALLDDEGAIVAVNRAWRAFGSRNGADPTKTGIGVNYLVVCDDAAKGGADESAANFAAGLRDVLNGARGTFEIEVPTAVGSAVHQFRARASVLADEGRTYVLVSHEDLTASYVKMV